MSDKTEFKKMTDQLKDRHGITIVDLGRMFGLSTTHISRFNIDPNLPTSKKPSVLLLKVMKLLIAGKITKGDLDGLE